MREVRRAVAHDDGVGHADARKVLSRSKAPTSSVLASSRRCRSRSTRAHAVYSTVAKPWSALRAAFSRSTRAFGDGPACDVVAGVALEDFRLLQPVLEELGGELDEVAIDAGAGEVGVGDVREQAVQSVAELVEEGAGVVEAEQRRRPGFGLGEAHDVGDDRTDVARQLGRGSRSSRHHCASRAAEIVAEEEPDMPAVRAVHVRRAPSGW